MIYYLTRTFAPYHTGGGPLMRKAAVDFLRKLGWKVCVVMPAYPGERHEVTDYSLRTPFAENQRLASLKERVGLIEDYLDSWVEETYPYLASRVRPDDLLFATTGGEMGPIILGAKVKATVGCRLVVNFRDPINYGPMLGLRMNKKPHVDRRSSMSRNLAMADVLVTSSLRYKEVLASEFPELSSKLEVNLFGYSRKIDIDLFSKTPARELRICYSGTMTKTQQPEMLLHAVQRAKVPCKVTFVGNSGSYSPLRRFSNSSTVFLEQMAHEEFLRFMAEEVDVGYVGLGREYFGACIPSKVYEYINLGLPIIGLLPDGDARSIIDDNGYGITCPLGDIVGLSGAINRLAEDQFRIGFVQRILADRHCWYMGNRINGLHQILERLVHS